MNLSPVQTSAPVINDPGFESTPIGLGQFIYDPSDSAWDYSLESGLAGAGLAANGSNFTQDSPDAPDGVQVAFLQKAGTISQSIDDWQAGSYQVSFQVAQRLYYNSASEDFQLLLDGTVIGTFPPSDSTYQTYTTAAFAATAGTHTLTFQGLDSAGGDNTALLDAVGVATSNITPNWTQTTTDADGDSTTEAVSYTVNPDGTATTETKLTDTYGDPSAAGTDVIGMDPASIPNGGIDSMDFTVTTGPIATITTLTEDDKDSYSQNSSVTGATSSGTQSISGSDSTNETSTTTDYIDGTSSSMSTTNDKSSDQFSLTVTGSSDTLANFTLTVSGTESSTTDDNDSPGNDQDFNDVSVTATTTVAATAVDGSNLMATQTEAATNDVTSTRRPPRPRRRTRAVSRPPIRIRGALVVAFHSI